MTDKMKCPFCSFESQSFKSLLLHVKQKHRYEKCCPVCGCEYSDLLRHLAQKVLAGDKEHRYAYVLFSRHTRSVLSKKVREELIAEGVLDA